MRRVLGLRSERYDVSQAVLVLMFQTYWRFHSIGALLLRNQKASCSDLGPGTWSTGWGFSGVLQCLWGTYRYTASHYCHDYFHWYHSQFNILVSFHSAIHGLSRLGNLIFIGPCIIVITEEFYFSLQPGHYSSLTGPNLQHTANQERSDQYGNQHRSRELLMMGIVMPETCWAYKRYNKIISDI